MEVSSPISRAPIFSLFVAASLLLGWFVPGFYAWTDSDQSRPSALLWMVPLWSAIASAAFCMVLPWLPIMGESSNDAPRILTRFSVRSLLIFTAGVALAIHLHAEYSVVVSGTVSAAALAYLFWFCLKNPHHCLAASALAACMFLPYAWVIGYDELDRIFPTLLGLIAGMPAFLPAALLTQAFGQHLQESQWLALTLTAVELLIGIWMIRLGPRRTIAYLLLVMQLSAVGSLGFYMLCRA